METLKFNIENLSEEQIKSIAILQHTGDPYFVLDDKVYLGDIAEALEAYLNTDSLLIEDKGLTIEDILTYSNPGFEAFCATEYIEVEPYDEDDYNKAYMCLTDSEADNKAAEYIKDSLWAFNASFLSDQTGLDEEVFQAIIDNGKCEDNNDVMYNTIAKLGDIKEFIDAAISTDGRGHFMSSYDGEENEENVGGEIFFIYRMN